ncbi:MAG: M20 family metallopeptidase [Acidobacteriota bacterium]|nr:M20 family metallopeptidase [Acidobacteriota bacterium]
MLERLRTLVEIESPSSSKAGVDRAQTTFAEWASACGGEVRRYAHAAFGDSIGVSFGRGNRGAPPVMLLGHLDTVWELGTLAHMPWRVTRDRICGPGVLDMKAGVLMALTALEVLLEQKLLRRAVTLLIHGEEEVGSPVSRALTEKIARSSSAVYVLEPGQGEAGAYKTARKAVGRYHLAVTGKAAHSGVDFEKGHSAVVELARQIALLQTHTDLGKGITVNPGVIGGGTSSNVVAAEAWVEIDVRIARTRDLAKVDRALRALKPVDKGCTLGMTGGINRPPMERTAGTAALFRLAQERGALLGIALEEASTGGASDGNFTSALGVATLDGMGAVGAGAHAAHEYLLRKHLVPRTALLAAMLL